jgi:hypothetical protein
LLKAPWAAFAEPFSEIRGIRELTDGTVLVADGRELRVDRVDFVNGTRQRVGAIGSGPGEYQWPTGLIALPGDSTAIIDGMSVRFLIVRADGKTGGTIDRRGVPTGTEGSLSLAPVQAFDSLGMAYGAAQPVRLSGSGTPQVADSFAVQRWRPGRSGRDTVAFVAVDKDPTRRASAGGVSTAARRVAFASADQWAVANDGRVAVVHRDPYFVEFVQPDGRRHIGAAVPYQRVRVTNAHRAQFLREANRPQMWIMFERRGMSPTLKLTRPVASEHIWEFPDYLPPFLHRAVAFASDGTLWIKRTTPASDPPTYDVLDRTGVVIRRVILRAHSTVVGFGRGVVYVARTDLDDLEYLERYALPL